MKTDERSTLVSSPVSASQPRVIRYIHANIVSAKWDADFAEAVPGVVLGTVGQDRDSYRAFLFEIQRRDRDAAIVLVSPRTQKGAPGGSTSRSPQATNAAHPSTPREWLRSECCKRSAVADRCEGNDGTNGPAQRAPTAFEL